MQDSLSMEKNKRSVFVLPSSASSAPKNVYVAFYGFPIVNFLVVAARIISRGIAGFRCVERPDDNDTRGARVTSARKTTRFRNTCAIVGARRSKIRDPRRPSRS